MGRSTDGLGQTARWVDALFFSGYLEREDLGGFQAEALSPSLFPLTNGRRALTGCTPARARRRFFCSFSFSPFLSGERG